MNERRNSLPNQSERTGEVAAMTKNKSDSLNSALDLLFQVEISTEYIEFSMKNGEFSMFGVQISTLNVGFQTKSLQI